MLKKYVRAAQGEMPSLLQLQTKGKQKRLTTSVKSAKNSINILLISLEIILLTDH